VIRFDHLGKIAPETFDRLRRVSTATLTTVLLKHGLRNTYLTGVRPLAPHYRMVGEAVTLRYVPAREDLDTLESLADPEHPQRKLVENILPGQVLVIDARRDVRAGALGHILATRLLRRGAAGVVTDGCYRDTPAMRELGLPAYAAGEHAAANVTVHHAADINVPVGCAGVLVMPGDIVAGDGEGVVVIPRHLADTVAEQAVEQEQLEEFIWAKINAGSSIVGVYPPSEAVRREYEVRRRVLEGC
jgi:regulator of RNase E activity RraA